MPQKMMCAFFWVFFTVVSAGKFLFNTPFNTTQLQVTAPLNSSEILLEWADQLSKTISQQIEFAVFDLLANILPIQAMNVPEQATLDQLGKSFISNSTRDLLPNFNKDFPAVHGVNASNVRWFAEARNRKPDDPVLFFLHGGGYVSRMQTKYYGILGDLYHQLNNSRLSIVVLDYTPVTDATYPQQLLEAAAVYNVIANSSTNIWIEGDSAGGHLTLNLLRHAKYPVDGVPALKLRNGYAAQGIALYSPLTSVAENITYGGINLLYDLLAPNTKTRSSAALNPATDSINWSNVLPPNKTNIFLQYGQDESLRDQIEEFIKIANLDKTNATITMEEHGQHDAFSQGPDDIGAWAQIMKFHNTTSISV